MDANTIARRPLGTTNVLVTTLGLGGGALGGLYDAVAPNAACETVHAAYAAGIRYFDTAPLYGHGRSEQRLGLALSDYDRASFVLSAKVGIVIEPELLEGRKAEDRYADPFLIEGRYDYSRDAVLRSFDASLTRLRTDRLDVVYIHDPDEGDSLLPPAERTGASHFTEVMEGAYPALHELREQGIIGAIGVGLNGTEMLTELARAGDFDAFLLAGRYTLLEQGGFDDLFPVCTDRGISIVVGGLFNSGILATGSVPGATHNYRPASPAVLDRVREFEVVCAEYDVTLAAAALQFPLANPLVSAVIPGMRSVDEVATNVARMAQPIPAAFWSRLQKRGLLDRRAAVPS